MKNRFLSSLRKYWFCFLLSVLMVIGLCLTAEYADVYQTGSEGDMIRFNLGDLYLIYGIPIYSCIYGCLSFAILKKAWFPQLILFAVVFTFFLTQGIAEALAWEGTYIWSAVPVVFSLIGTAITALICFIIKSMKEN